MDDSIRRLFKYIDISEQGRAILSRFRGLEISALEFQKALQDKLGLDNPFMILDREPILEDYLDLLKDYDFIKYKSEYLEEVFPDESIIPQGIPRLLTEEVIKHKNEKWVIYKNDLDPFPSTPHAHNYSSGLKLCLKTGNQYDKTKKLVHKISKKQLIEFRKKIRYRPLPDIEV